MQELGFGLTVFQVRNLAYDLTTSQDTEHMFNPVNKVGSKWWWWWSKFTQAHAHAHTRTYTHKHTHTERERERERESHLLGVYRSLKRHQSRKFSSYLLEHPHNKPSRFRFNELYNATFLESFSSLKIINAVMKTGA